MRRTFWLAYTLDRIIGTCLPAADSHMMTNELATAMIDPKKDVADNCLYFLSRPFYHVENQHHRWQGRSNSITMNLSDFQLGMHCDKSTGHRPVKGT